MGQAVQNSNPSSNDVFVVCVWVSYYISQALANTADIYLLSASHVPFLDSWPTERESLAGGE